MPRFVILRHETPAGSPRPAHFDLMLEAGDVLRTWACETLPAAELEVPAEKLADHRHDYLEYEGEISGGRGSVSRVAAGEYESLEESPNLWRVRLKGELRDVGPLSGELTLTRDAVNSHRWRVSLRAG